MKISSMNNDTGRWLIGGLFLMLALAYGVMNPLFEAPDEHWHFFTALAIAEEKRLPQVSDPPDPWLGQEAAQPPLYYLLGALIVAPVETDGAREMVWPNPRLQVGDASAVHNLNAFVHGPWEVWPWRGHVLAAHLLRAFSSLLGLGTLFFIYGGARQLWPERPQRALLSMAMTAFLPQFLFVHSAVTNDALITLLCAAAIWQLLRLWRNPARAPSLILLGFTVGLAILTKTAGLLLLAYTCGVLLLRGLWHDQRLPQTVGQITLLVVAPALVTGGWLLLRNWQLYGDTTAANQFVAIAGGDRGYTLGEVLAESEGLWTSLFAVFGWFNVRLPAWVYAVWNGLVGLAIGGAAWQTFMVRSRTVYEDARRTQEGVIVALWLALWVALVYAGLVLFMLRTPAAQGRLLFPALMPLALGLALGLDGVWHVLRGALASVSLTRRAAPTPFWVIAPLVALITSLYGLLVVIPQIYEEPSVLVGDALPAGIVTVEEERAQLDEGPALLGYELERDLAQPGDVVWLTLYWAARETNTAPIGAFSVPAPQQPQMIGPGVDAPQLVLELFGRQERLIGKYQGYHGGGLYPTPLWPAGAVVAERVGVRLSKTMQAPVLARVQLGIAKSAQRLTLGMVEVEPSRWPAAPKRERAMLGESVRLVQANVAPNVAQPGDAVHLTLVWHVLQDVDVTYATFVHLGAPAEQPLAQGDDVPLAGYYPTTLWQAGEVIAGDDYVVHVPPSLAPGRYPVLVGLYDPQSGQRLPLYVDGARQDHDAFVVAWLDVR